MEAVPGVAVLMFGQVVVEGLVNGFDVRLDGVADDTWYTFRRFIDGLKRKWLVVAVEMVSLGEMLKPVYSGFRAN